MLTVAAVKSITETVIQRHPRDSRISSLCDYIIVLCGYVVMTDHSVVTI